MSIEKEAIKYVIKYLRKKGFDVGDVSRKRGYNGYDLLAQKKRKKPVRIEVKGCTRPWCIPDPYITEFDNQKSLVADFMYVVYFLGNSRPALYIIPRKAFKPEFIKPKCGYRISSRFKNEQNLKKYKQIQ